MVSVPFFVSRVGWADTQLALRAAVAAALSLIAAQCLALAYPIYAFLAAVIVNDLDPATSQKLGLRRLGSTSIGAICGAFLSVAVPPGPWSVVLGVLGAMSVAQLLGAGEGARVAAYISGLVLLDHSSAPWHYAFHRFLEAALGVMMAWAISFVPKLIKSARRNGNSSG